MSKTGMFMFIRNADEAVDDVCGDFSSGSGVFFFSDAVVGVFENAFAQSS